MAAEAERVPAWRAKAVIFDLDGLLVDTESLCRWASSSWPPWFRPAHAVFVGETVPSTDATDVYGVETPETTALGGETRPLAPQAPSPPLPPPLAPPLPRAGK